MTDKLALIVALALLAAIIGDIVFHSGASLLFLSRKLIGLLEWMAVWR